MNMLARLFPGAAAEPPSAADPSLPLTIDVLARRDLHIIGPIEAEAYPTGWSRQVFESEIERMRDGDRYYVVAKFGPAIVGYAGLWFVDDPAGDQAHITTVVVAAGHRRRGIATAMLVDLARVAAERGCVAWTLEVRATATGAQALYQRFGFTAEGVRKRYYENAIDAVVMWCHDLGDDSYLARLDDLLIAVEPATELKRNS